jgi:hypothetical protein
MLVRLYEVMLRVWTEGGAVKVALDTTEKWAFILIMFLVRKKCRASGEK